VRLFKRNALLLVLSLAAAGVVFGVMSAATLAVERLAQERGWEPARVAGALVRAFGGLAILAFFYAALDYARIENALDGSRRAFRVWFSGLRFVLRHFLGSFLLLLSAAAAAALLLAVYAGFRETVPARTWLLILLVFAAQQVVVFARFVLRIALLSGQIGFYLAMNPPGPPARCEPESSRVEDVDSPEVAADPEGLAGM
jgi:hypothetical protein